MTCDLQSAGMVDLYFYGELSARDRADVQIHLRQCAICRQALEELSVIRAALASRRDVATPPGGEWSGFMARLAESLEHSSRQPGFRRFGGPPGVRGRVWFRISPARPGMFARPGVVGYVALAALLALVTAGILVVAPGRRTVPAPDQIGGREVPATLPAAIAPQLDPALVSLSGSHFERSKLVLLDLTTTDSASLAPEQWSRDRERAATLLNDTRVYRLAAEERGMTTLAGVMRDLELVLLQTSMSEEPDAESVEQLQRLIRRRDLLTKMDVVFASGR